MTVWQKIRERDGPPLFNYVFRALCYYLINNRLWHFNNINKYSVIATLRKASPVYVKAFFIHAQTTSGPGHHNHSDRRVTATTVLMRWRHSGAGDHRNHGWSPFYRGSVFVFAFVSNHSTPRVGNYQLCGLLWQTDIHFVSGCI